MRVPEYDTTPRSPRDQPVIPPGFVEYAAESVPCQAVTPPCNYYDRPPSERDNSEFDCESDGSAGCTAHNYPTLLPHINAIVSVGTADGDITVNYTPTPKRATRNVRSLCIHYRSAA